MTLTRRCLLTLTALLFVLNNLPEFPLPAQEAAPPASTPLGNKVEIEADPVPDRDRNAELPEAVRMLTPTIVTITRIEPTDEAATSKAISHAGIVVDPRGYILAPWLPSKTRSKQFVVRLADQQEFIAEEVGSDERLKLRVLKINSPQPLAAIPLKKIREAQVGDKLWLVSSTATKQPLSGRVTSILVGSSCADSTKLIQLDSPFPPSQYGSLVVSELGEPVGLFMAYQAGESPVSLASPMTVAMEFVYATTKSKPDAAAKVKPEEESNADSKLVWTGEKPAASKPADERPAQLKVFKLQNASAVKSAARLKELNFKARITADPRTNSAFAYGDEEELLIIEAILFRLDEARSRPTKK